MIQALLTAAVYLLGMWYIRNSTKQRYEEWDLKTVTISDYTVKYDVPERLYEKYLEEHATSPGVLASESDFSTEFEQESPLYGFKKTLKREIERKIKEVSPIMYDNDDLCVVSEINFIFKNTPIINMIIDRGNALDDENEEKAIKIENKIKDHLREHHRKVSTPKEAYITFKTEEAYLRGVKLDSTKICGKEVPKETWKGYPFVLEQVQEPTNIYWENRHASTAWKFIKQVIVTIILILILAIFITILFYTQKVNSRLRREYPEVDCDEVKEDLVGDSMLKQFARIEWFHWQQNDGTEESVLKLSTSNLQ